ncbi:MAG: hypothetical protein HQL80_06710 [Magnetococcales bacterium]|nr:hypothetical protein [Magnetococcales bacterium]
MNKISMGVAVLAASLALSGAAFAGSETPATSNGRPMVAPVADAKVAPTANKDASGRLMAAATNSKEQKATQDAQSADAKGATAQKSGHDAKQHKPETTAKSDAKAVTPAPVAAQEGNTKR